MMTPKADWQEPDPDVDTLAHSFRHHAESQADKTAFIIPHSCRKRTLLQPINGKKSFNYEEITWGEAGRIVAALTHILHWELGVRQGDRVGKISWSRAEGVLLALAAWNLGAIIVGIDPRSSAEQVKAIVDDADHSPDARHTEVRVVVCEDEEQIRKVDQARIWANIRVVRLDKLIASARQRLARYVLAACGDTPLPASDDIAMLLYTSGSTGEPKGVIITHRNLAWSAAQICGNEQLFDDDVFFGQLPDSHILTWNGVGPCLWRGLTMFLCRPDPLEMPVHWRRVRPTIMIGVTKFWAAVMDKVTKPPKVTLPVVPRSVAAAVNYAIAGLHAAALKRAMTPQDGRLNRALQSLVRRGLAYVLGGRLRILITGGAAFPDSLAITWATLYKRLRVGYGASETLGSATVETEAAFALGSSGKALPHVVVSFEPRPDEDLSSSAAPGTKERPGIICVSGPTVARGYWNKKELTAKVFREGRFVSDDFGFVDTRGLLFVLGRDGDDGKTLNGEKVSSIEIRDVFEQSSLIHIVPVFQSRPFVAALVLLKEPGAVELLLRKGLVVPGQRMTMEYLAGHPAIVDAVRQEIEGKNAVLGQKGQWKRIRQFRIVPETPTTENRMLSGKLELSAKGVMKRHAALIEAMYS